MMLQKLTEPSGQLGQGLHTGAKKLENGSPLLRAKAQSCRDEAARIAMVPTMKLITKMIVIKSEAPRLWVALKNRLIRG